MANRFPATKNGVVRKIGGSAVHAFAVTKSDSTVFEVGTSGLFVGGAGNVVVTMASGDEVTFQDVVAGTVLPIECVQVKAATTATKITAMV
jgi:D-aminopeptidase